MIRYKGILGIVILGFFFIFLCAQKICSITPAESLREALAKRREKIAPEETKKVIKKAFTDLSKSLKALETLTKKMPKTTIPLPPPPPPPVLKPKEEAPKAPPAARGALLEAIRAQPKLKPTTPPVTTPERQLTLIEEMQRKLQQRKN